MNQKTIIVILVVLICLSFVDCRREYNKRYYSGRRHTKQIHRYSLSPLDCEAHEHFKRCGEEAHCDLSCANFLNPPSCKTDYENPKCYFPRCICDPGFARHHERCVPKSVCKKIFLRSYEKF